MLIFLNCPPLSTLSTPYTGGHGGQSCLDKMAFFHLCENWLRAIEISLPQERQRRSMLTDKMAEENDRNGI